MILSSESTRSASAAARFADALYARTLRSAAATAACGAAAAEAPGARDPPGTPTACARHSFASDVANLAPTGPTALAGAPAAFESDSAAAARDMTTRALAGDRKSVATS